MTLLIEQGDHEVVSFADGLEALACITQDRDVRTLITSTQPLGITGIELCAAARKLSGSRRALHVILMSSTDDYYLAVTALDNGADDFIHKPPNPDELRARLRLADRVTSMKQQLIQYATTDSLTGLNNRRAFFDGAAELRRVTSGRKPLSVIMFDIDHFKRINDSYGHDIGDRVLAAVGGEAKMPMASPAASAGKNSVCSPMAASRDAMDVAGELQRSIRALRFHHEGQSFGVTCSFGVAEWEEQDTIDRLMRRADMAMYEAKKSGRDRIVASDTFVLTTGHDEWAGATRTAARQL